MISPRGAWPPLTYEELTWELDDSAPTSRSARRRHRGLYRAGVVPEIAATELNLSGEAGALAEDAAAEIADSTPSSAKRLPHFPPCCCAPSPRRHRTSRT